MFGIVLPCVSHEVENKGQCGFHFASKSSLGTWSDMANFSLMSKQRSKAVL